MARIVVVAVVLLGLVGAADARQLRLDREPGPLQGIPLRGPTGIRLVVADRPVILDVDTGSVTRVRRGRSAPRAHFGVVGVGGRAAVVIAERGRIYAIRDEKGSLSPLGAGAEVAPDADARSVWVKRLVHRKRCTLRRVGLDGRVIRAARAFRCSRTIYPGGSLGLGVSRTRVIDPVTRRTVFRTRLGIVAVAGKTVVLRGGPGNPLTLVDTATGARRGLPWPDTDGQLGAYPAVDVRGRYVALLFGNPSWTSEAGQYFDMWVLDTETAKLMQLPGMPAFVWLKWTNMAWTEDGRLVLLTRSAGKDFVAVWKPGQDRLELKTVQLPGRDSIYNNSFAPLG